MSVKKPSMDLFTCVTCNVTFEDSEQQRDHYKTDWHRYNLKRKVAELPVISFQDFQERVKLQKTQLENSQNQVNDELFCKLCCKHFNTKNSFANHTQSKKHKELEFLKSKQTEEPIVIKSDRSTKKIAQMEEYLKKQEELLKMEEMEDDGDQEWEDVVDEDMSNFDEANGIDILTCLFCEQKFDSCVEKCEHMAKEHSFYIPDMEYVSDLEGLLKFLGIKLGAYHVCLWCSNKVYRDLRSVQKHMIDKGHQKMKFEGDTLVEYADFYSYGEETDDDYEIVDDSDLNMSQLSVVDDQIINNEGFELVLPSGSKIGHRSLFRYYKQSFGHRNLELKQRSNLTVRDKYKAISNNQSYSNAEIQKQRKDIAYLKRWSSRMYAKVGCDANKLQKHFRRQDLCF
ncbi:zinc finger protein 622-like [Brachionus plicatilis]|uniref:Zinc finger protein 622-like n=1 Tax=Brachionus plicatilis TaxID=10195 RepID=A0A3M7RZ21_BRAPC|nr:zinc finger protein 622-like [Brachionus plicatilis]